MGRLTKIIATIGPACAAEGALDALIAAGTDVFRLNFSHGTHEEHGAVITRIRDAAARSGRHVAILQDLSGPKIRTGKLVDRKAIDLVPGAPLEIATGDFVGGPGRVSTTFAGLAKAVRPGDRLLLDDGRIELRVESSDGTTAKTTVVGGGALGEHKGINLPGVALPASALTPKDIADLRFGLSRGVDIVALSFVQTAEDLRMARAIVAESGDGRTPLVAKIERPAAVDNLDAILGAADAVMVARGDLGLEMPFERVPRGPEGDHAARAPPRPAGDRRDAGLRLDAHRAAADPRRGERRRQRRRRRRRRDHADRRDRHRHRSDAHRADARRGDPRRRVADAVARDRSRPRGHRRPAQPRAVPVGGDAGGERERRRHRRGDARRQDRAHAVGLPPRASASSRSRRTPPIARRFAIYRGVLPLVADIDPTGLAIERQLRERNLLPAGSVVVFLSVNADLTRSDANFLRIRRI